jgi:hypothetical protein
MVISPSSIALQKETRRRTASGFGASIIKSREKFARWRQWAIPLAISPAPLIPIVSPESIFSLPYWVRGRAPSFYGYLAGRHPAHSRWRMLPLVPPTFVIVNTLNNSEWQGDFPPSKQSLLFIYLIIKLGGYDVIIIASDI